MECILRWLTALTLVVLIMAASMEQMAIAIVALICFALAAWAYLRLPGRR